MAVEVDLFTPFWCPSVPYGAILEPTWEVFEAKKPLLELSWATFESFSGPQSEGILAPRIQQIRGARIRQLL